MSGSTDQNQAVPPKGTSSLFASVDDRAVMRAIASADEASTSMTPYGPMNDKWLRRFAQALANEGLTIAYAPPPEPLDALEPSAFYRMMCDAEDNGDGFVNLVDVFSAVSDATLDAFIPARIWDLMGRPDRVRVELTAVES